MNRARRGARPLRHPLRQPDRARPARQLLERRRPGDADPAPARDPGLRQDRRPRAAPPAQPPPAAADRDDQRTAAPRALGDRREDRPHLRRRLRPGRLRQAQGRRPDLGRDRRADRRSALRATASSCSKSGFAQYRGGCRSAPGRTSPTLDPLRRRRAAAAGRAQRSPPASTAASGSASTSRRPHEVEGPIERGARPRPRRRSSSTAARRARPPLRAGRAIPKAGALRPGAQLRRRTPDSHRAGAVRDTDWRSPPVARDQAPEGTGRSGRRDGRR